MTERSVGAFHPIAPLPLGHVGRIVRAFPGSQVISPSFFNTSRWCHTVVVDLPTVLAISLTVVGWVLMTVFKTVIRDTERMLATPRPCNRVGVRSRHMTSMGLVS